MTISEDPITLLQLYLDKLAEDHPSDYELEDAARLLRQSRLGIVDPSFMTRISLRVHSPMGRSDV